MSKILKCPVVEIFKAGSESGTQKAYLRYLRREAAFNEGLSHRSSLRNTPPLPPAPFVQEPVQLNLFTDQDFSSPKKVG